METRGNNDVANLSDKAPRGASWIVSALFAVGFVFVFVGERLLGAGSGRTAMTVLGLLLVVAAVAWRLARQLGASGDARRIERILRALMDLGLLALALYFLQSDVGAKLFGGKLLSVNWPRLATVMQALWPAIWLAGAVPIVLVELSYASMAHAPHREVDRIKDAAMSGFGIAFALIFAFAITYVASERNHKVDLAYFRTTRPGESTKKIVAALDQPVTIAYFFPPANEVRDEVAGYLDLLAKESPKLEVKAYDQAVDPAKAKELGVSANGMVVVSRGQRREQLSLGTQLENARTQPRTLDKEMQKRLLAVSRPARTVYLTTGHGERTAEPANETDKRPGIRALRQYLTEQNYSLRDLGAAEGLATDVPADAGIVMIVGPTRALDPAESASIGRFLDKGGRLFVAVDPDTGLDHKDLLAPLGLTFTPVTLANDQVFVRLNRQPSDRINLATASFSSSPTVATLGRARVPLVLPGAGALSEVKEAKDKPKGTQIDFVAHAQAATFDDKNGNFEVDAPAETRKTWELAAAVTRANAATGAKAAEAKPEARAVVVGDSDFIADVWIAAPFGNGQFLIDSVKWLFGEEAITGEVASEADVPIAHTKNQDALWFYSTIFFAPALVLVLGRLATRRRGRSLRRNRDSKDVVGKEAV